MANYIECIGCGNLFNTEKQIEMEEFETHEC